MRKDMILGLAFMAISFSLPYILGIFNENVSKSNILSLISGLGMGLGICFIIIGALPPSLYDSLQAFKTNIKNFFA